MLSGSAHTHQSALASCSRPAGEQVLEGDGHVVIVLPDGDDFRAITNATGDLPREGLADPAHAADGLEHGGLKVVEQETLQAPPQARGQNIVQPDRVAVDRLRAEAASRMLCITPMGGRILADPIAEVLVERAERPQRLEQDLLILCRHRVVERALFRRLGQELGDAAVEIGLDVADALRLAVERIGGMQIGVVVELDEGLERDPEAAAIVQDCVMMIGNPPRPRIEIEARVELAPLRCSAELGVDVAAPRIVQFRPPGRRLNSSTLTA